MSKTWLVTGSGRGLGRSIAEAVLENGDRLVATARNIERLAELQQRYGDQVKLATLDVTDTQAARAAVQLAVDTFGGLDVLVNNAGFSYLAPFEQVSEDQFKAVIDTDFYGVVNLMRAAIPVMRQQRAGHIINISSAGGRVGAPAAAAYYAAKFAVGGLTESVAAEVAPLGIKVISVEPGGMRTECSHVALANAPKLLPDYEASVGAMMDMLKKYDGNEIGDPVKIANVIVDLSRRNALPTHLILGSDALFGIEMGGKARAKAAAEWEEISKSTDFEGSDLSLLAGLSITS